MLIKKIRYSEVCNIDCLKKGFTAIKSNTVFRFGGISKENCVTENGIRLSKILKEQKYQPRCSRKVLIFKARGGMRCSGLISVTDKVVQKRILELLAPVAELLFSDQPSGFRLRKGSHDALKYVKSYWSNVTWIIRVNIEKHFARINHKILLAQMCHYMDQSTLELISKFCDVWYIKCEHSIKFPKTFEQISHGFILFPLLCNIYFLSLDEFILNNWAYFSFMKDIQATVLNCNKKNCVGSGGLKLRQVLNDFKKSQQSESVKAFIDKRAFWRGKPDSAFRVPYYVRYATNCMLGYTGSKLQVNKVYDTIINYISDPLKFVLHPGEANVVDSNRHVKYLGTWICWEKNSKMKTLKLFNLSRSFRNTSLNRPYFKVVLGDLFMEMFTKGYHLKKIEYSKIAQESLWNKSRVQDIYCIVKSFNRAVRNVVNYYSFVSCRSKLWKIVDVYRNGCAAIIANKLKLKTAAQVFQKFGRFLILENDLGDEAIRFDTWPYNLKTKKKFNVTNFKTNFSFLVKKIDGYLKYF
jgi:Type II intron maturase/Reverse transcriptase (RNA-dependent DNA polymerase)